MAFQRNNFLISSFIREYKELLSFDLSIAEAIGIVKSWHSITNKHLKTVDYTFSDVKYSKEITEEIEKDK